MSASVFPVYPPIHVAEKNPAYAKLMLSNVGGEDSELSAIAMYFYGSLVMREYPVIANAFHQIAETEMRHLNIFGSLAHQLGADPRPWGYRGKKKVYWSPRNVRYTTKARRALSNALFSEYMAVERYLEQASKIKDEGVVENLNRIILDEKQHIKELKALVQQI